MSILNPSTGTPIAPSQLFALVATEVALRVVNSQPFSAFDITQALRAADPNADVPHDSVRSIVGLAIEGEIQLGLYEVVRHASGNFRVFSPVAALPTAGDGDGDADADADTDADADASTPV
jgi:hypothetical protein